MFYPRKILPKIEKELNTKEILVLTGLRQTGKTTILNYLFSKISSTNKTFLDLENPLHRKVFEEENFDNIWKNLEKFKISKDSKAFIFVDEIQNLPQISQALKYLYDHWQVKFFLTGSSSFYLKNLFSESMAGRKLVFELFPLTFEEFLIFKGLEKQTPVNFSQKAQNKNKISYEQYFKYYQEFMEFGGFPAVVLESNQERKKQLLGEIFKSYFEKDVKNLADFKNISKLRDLILLLVPRLASKIEISKIASELGLTRETIYSYLSFLEQTYFISLLPKFTKSFDRQVAGGKKLYFGDTGLANFLGKASLSQLFENSIFQNLRPLHKLNFFSQDKKEIDFIVDEKIGLEAKMSFSQKDLFSLLRRKEALRLNEAYLVSLNWTPKEEAILAIDL